MHHMHDRRLTKVEQDVLLMSKRFDQIDNQLAEIRVSIQTLTLWTNGIVLGTWVTIMLAIIGFGIALLHK